MTTPRNRFRPTVPEVMPLVDAYYQFDGCGVGGVLHCVLDDYNVEDDMMPEQDYCLSSDRHNGPDVPGWMLTQLITLMSVTQRLKLARASHYDKPDCRMDRDAFIAACQTLLEKYA